MIPAITVLVPSFIQLIESVTVIVESAQKNTIERIRSKISPKTLRIAGDIVSFPKTPCKIPNHKGIRDTNKKIPDATNRRTNWVTYDPMTMIP
ncbi:MAG: hypothetical protein NTZ39_05495 [Methanoregula sp.]|nr:hypothetical protein [Methanoregula sp.]